MRKVVIYGGGGHACVVADCLHDAGFNVSGYYANEEASLLGIPWLGQGPVRPEATAGLIIAIGDNSIRKKLAEEFPTLEFITTIHPSAVISKHTSLGAGSMILHGVIVQARSAVGKHVILNTGCQVDHDASIADYVHIGPRSVLCGNVTIGEGTFVGAGSTILPGVKIGAWSVIGAGSVVVADVPDGKVVKGVPARIKE